MSCNSASTPAEVNMKLVKNEDEELVDPTLRYLCKCRLCISYVVCIISKFISEPRSSHLLAVKRFMRCIKGTSGYGILFPTNANGVTINLISYLDADWCGDKQDKKSTLRYLFKFLNAPI